MAKGKVGVHGTDEETGRSKGTVCPLSLEQFKGKAKPVMVTIQHGGDTVKIVLDAREFSSGSFGWFANEKSPLMIDGVPVKVQCNLNMTVVNSKDAPRK